MDGARAQAHRQAPAVGQLHECSLQDVVIHRLPYVDAPELIDFWYMKLTPAQNGALKQLAMVVILAVVAWLANVAHLSPAIGVPAAVFVSMLASSLESYIKDYTDKGMFGAVTIKR